MNKSLTYERIVKEDKLEEIEIYFSRKVNLSFTNLDVHFDCFENRPRVTVHLSGQNAASLIPSIKKIRKDLEEILR